MTRNAYILRKLVSLPFVMLFASVLIFVAMRALPGDPARLIAGPGATQQAVQSLHARLGLDRPMMAQYVGFLRDAVHGDLGNSIAFKEPVTTTIATRLPNTLLLALVSYTAAILLGVPTGMIAAIYRGRWPDRVIGMITILSASVANFWLALVMMEIFAVQLHWLPLLGAGGASHLVLPAITLALLPTALISRMTRIGMIEVLSQDYIRTARAKGLGSFPVYCRHALRNALLPIVTIVGLNFGSVVGGTVVTETVFDWPGTGRLLVEAVRYRDYPVMQAVTLLAVLSVILVNLAAELVITMLDPRVSPN